MLKALSDLSNAGLVVTGPPGAGKTMIVGHIIKACLQRGDRVTVSSGASHTAATWSALARLRDLRKWAQGYQEALNRPTVTVPTAALLSTSEADNKLPAITSPSVLGDTAPRTEYSGPETVGLLKSLRLLLKAIDRPIQLLDRVLEVLLGIRRFEDRGPAPALATSPCGVIRFAAPRVPRAPGCGQAMSLAFDHCALAA